MTEGKTKMPWILAVIALMTIMVFGGDKWWEKKEEPKLNLSSEEIRAQLIENHNKKEAKRKIEFAVSNLKIIKAAILQYNADTGVWPKEGISGSGLVNSDGRDGWDGPYLSAWPRSPWKTKYKLYWQDHNIWDRKAKDKKGLYLKVENVPLPSARIIKKQIGYNSLKWRQEMFFIETREIVDVNYLIALSK